MEMDPPSTVESDKPIAPARTFLADSQGGKPIDNTTAATAEVELHNRDMHYDGDDEAEAEPSERVESSFWHHTNQNQIKTLSTGIQKLSQRHNKKTRKQRSQGLLLHHEHRGRDRQSWRGRYVSIQARVRETARRSSLSTFLGEGARDDNTTFLMPRAVRVEEDRNDDSASAQKGGSDNNSDGLLAR